MFHLRQPQICNIPPLTPVAKTPFNVRSLRPSPYYPANHPQAPNQIQAGPGTGIPPGLTLIVMLVWRDNPLLHFGVLFQNSRTLPGGYMLDVTRHDRNQPWRYRFPVFLEFATRHALRFLNEDHDSPSFLDGFHLGYIDDRNVARLHEISHWTPLPSGPSENCQTWALKVIEQACRERILFEDVYHRAVAVPKWSPFGLGVPT